MEFVQPIRDRRQVNAMKKILKGTNMRDYCLFVLGINSGLRISDLLKLTLRDVMDDTRNLRDRISIRETKTNKTKDFPVGETARQALKEYLSHRKPSSLNEPLFPSRKGNGLQSLQRAQAWRMLNTAAREVGIQERIGTHTLRKTFGYHAYQQGKDITLIQQLLNHHSPATTLRYIGITQDDIDNVYMTVNL